MAKIVAIAGSLREKSFTGRILNIAIEGARNAGAEVTLVDLRDLPMAIYNADDHAAEGFDANGLLLQEILGEHEGILIASPEYNGSLPGGLKNAIDWASRKSDRFGMNEVFRDKTAAMITSSPGSFGGLRCMGHLRGILSIMGVLVLPAEIAVSFVAEKFDGDGTDMTDEKMKAVLEKHGASLAKALDRS